MTSLQKRMRIFFFAIVIGNVPEKREKGAWRYEEEKRNELLVFD